MRQEKRQLRGRTKVPPRWLIVATVLTGVAIDVATIAWLWNVVPFSGPMTTGQFVIAFSGTALSGLVMALGVYLGVKRSRG